MKSHYSHFYSLHEILPDTQRGVKVMGFGAVTDTRCLHARTNSQTPTTSFFFSLPNLLFLLLLVLLFFSGFDAGSLEGADGGNSSGIFFCYVVRLGYRLDLGCFVFLIS